MLSRSPRKHLTKVTQGRPKAGHRTLETHLPKNIRAAEREAAKIDQLASKIRDHMAKLHPDLSPADAVALELKKFKPQQKL